VLLVLAFRLLALWVTVFLRLWVGIYDIHGNACVGHYGILVTLVAEQVQQLDFDPEIVELMTHIQSNFIFLFESLFSCELAKNALLAAYNHIIMDTIEQGIKV